MTKNHLWTTIDPSITGTLLEILGVCPIKLVYLGDNRFGRLWPKLILTAAVSTLQTNVQPVFPKADAQPLVNIPAPYTLEELGTGCTLLTMQENPDQSSQMSKISQNLCNLNLQEPSVKTNVQPTELVFKNSPAASFELVETVNLSNLAMLDWDKMPACTVELVHIKYTPTLKLPTLQTIQDLKALDQYFTRSKSKPYKQRQGRRPRSASTDIQYNESTLLNDTDTNPKHKWAKTTPPVDDPTPSRVCAQTSTTSTPALCLPLLNVENR